MTTIATCDRCGLDVPTSNTTYSLQGALLCRNCGDRDGMTQQTGRARDAADERARRTRGWARVVANAQAQGVHTDMDRLETEFAREVSFTAANAQAVSFTCQPCGRKLPLEQGTYNPANRVLCETCFAADAERRRNARKSGPNEWMTFALPVMVVLVMLGFALYTILK